MEIVARLLEGLLLCCLVELCLFSNRKCVSGAKGVAIKPALEPNGEYLQGLKVSKGVCLSCCFLVENHGASCLKQCCAICPAKEELHFWVQNLRSGESQLVKRGKA